MKLWSIGHHRNLCAAPWEHKGVLITAEDLAHPEVSVWNPCPRAMRDISPTKITTEFSFVPSENSAAYLNMLRALVAFDDPELFAVVSLEWAPDRLGIPGFVTTRYVWVAVYHQSRETEVWRISHSRDRTPSPYTSFLHGLVGDLSSESEACAFLERQLRPKAA